MSNYLNTMDTIQVNDMKQLRKARLSHKGEWVVYTHNGHSLKCYDTTIQMHQYPTGVRGGSLWDMSVKGFNAYFEDLVFKPQTK